MAGGKCTKPKTLYGLPDFFDMGDISFYYLLPIFNVQWQPRVAQVLCIYQLEV